MTERAFQKAAVVYLRATLAPYGGIVVVIANAPPSKRNPVAGQVSGEPDVFCIVRGLVYAFELKAPKGRVKPHQKARHEQWEKAGAVVFVSRSLTDLESAVTVIKHGLVPEAKAA